MAPSLGLTEPSGMSHLDHPAAGGCEEPWRWGAPHLWPAPAPWGLWGWQDLTQQISGLCSLSGPRQQGRERKLCLPVSFLSGKALAWKPDRRPCRLPGMHLALRAPVACRGAKRRNSPRKTRKRLQVHCPEHHAAGQVWGKLFTFLRRKEILRDKLVTSPKMAQICCSFSRTCGKTTVLALLVSPRVKAKGSFLLWGHLFRLLQWKILQTSAGRRWRSVMQSSYDSHPHLIAKELQLLIVAFENIYS